MAGDSLARTRRDKPIGNEKVDKFTDGLGAQGFLQDATRSLVKWMDLVGRPNRLVGALAGIFAGESQAINQGVATAIARTDRAAQLVAPTRAAAVTRAATPFAEAAGATLRFVGKAGPVISVPFAYYDVAKAWTEPDKAKKDAAWMNATLTVGGTALGLASLVMSGPAVIPVLVASAGVALFQLADSYLWDGKAMDALGAHVMHPLRKLFGR